MGRQKAAREQAASERAARDDRAARLHEGWKPPNTPPAVKACSGAIEWTEVDRKAVLGWGADKLRNEVHKTLDKRVSLVGQPGSLGENFFDGVQTPRAGAIFVSMHATGTCCRFCTHKWHNILRGCERCNKGQGKKDDGLEQCTHCVPLSAEQMEYCTGVVVDWIQSHLLLPE